MTTTHDKAFTAIKKGLASAAKAAVLNEDQLEDALFPFWSAAIHELLVEQGACSCAAATCFAQMTKERQVGLLAGSELASYATFVELFREVVAEFFDWAKDKQVE